MTDFEYDANTAVTLGGTSGSYSATVSDRRSGLGGGANGG
jgi:hypothetical protein